MQVAKWGNSLAVRFPASLVNALQLKEWEEVELHLVGEREFEVSKKASATEMLDAVKATCTVVPLTVETHAKAVHIAQRYQLSFYDAHIVSAALASGVHTLMSEDMHHGLSLEGMRIQNPFRISFCKIKLSNTLDESSKV